MGDDRADFDGVRAQCAEPVRRTAAAVRFARVADAVHDAGATLYRPMVGPASGDPRHAVAVRLSWPGRREDLIGDCDRRPTTRRLQPIAVRRQDGWPMRLMEGLLGLALAVAPVCGAHAQDAMRGLDLTSPDMT